jgi:hypothetical protein
VNPSTYSMGEGQNIAYSKEKKANILKYLREYIIIKSNFDERSYFFFFENRFLP